MIAKCNASLFFAALALLYLFLFALAPDPGASAYENRAMAGQPQFNAQNLFSGKYAEELEAYLSDRVAFRTGFLSFAASLERARGLDRGGAVLVDVDLADLGAGLLPDSEDGQEDTQEWLFLPPADEAARGGQYGDEEGDTERIDSGPGIDQPAPAAAPIPAGHVDPGKVFSVDVYKNPDAVLYTAFYIDAASTARYIEILNGYRREIPDSIRIFCLLAPTRVEFMDEKYKSNAAPQGESIQNIYGKLSEGFVCVDAYSPLASRAEEEYLYFRTDHHWTALGAYYAYLAFAEAAGFAPVAIDQYVECAIPDYIGSLAVGTQSKTILESPDTLYYYQLDNGVTFSRRFFYIPEDRGKLSYRMFMGGDYPSLDYTSSNQNGKTLVVVKDSYANAFLPWISPHYERIIVLDPRQYKGSVVKLIESLHEADLLFLNYAMSASLPALVEKIAEIR